MIICITPGNSSIYFGFLVFKHLKALGLILSLPFLSVVWEEEPGEQ